MIKELRMGNLVYVGLTEATDTSEVKIVTSIGYSDGYLGCMVSNSYFDSSSTFFLIGHIHPIPLTEAYLLKLGIPKCERWDKYYEPFGGIYWSVNNNGEISVESESDYFIPAPEFVHRFQNLYFELEDKELTITEKETTI